MTDRPIVVDAVALAELVRTSALPVLVDFHAEWCGPCRFMAPVLERFAHDHAGEVVVAKLDTDHNEEAAHRYGIRGIPTLLLFLNGEEVDRQVGAVPAPYLENMLATAAQ
jgi:thioredoxin 1